jgi:hypothetical protein
VRPKGITGTGNGVINEGMSTSLDTRRGDESGEDIGVSTERKCVCVCVRERERERESARARGEGVSVVCVCVCLTV